MIPEHKQRSACVTNVVIWGEKYSEQAPTLAGILTLRRLNFM
jgi:hypothetical protein